MDMRDGEGVHGFLENLEWAKHKVQGVHASMMKHIMKTEGHRFSWADVIEITNILDSAHFQSHRRCTTSDLKSM